MRGSAPASLPLTPASANLAPASGNLAPLGTASVANSGACTTNNIALDRVAIASSEQNSGLRASAAFDGYQTTRWASAFSDPQWLQVDLGSVQSVCGVTLQWEAAYGKAFKLEISNDGTTWTPLYSTTSGTGGTQKLTVSGSGKYVRMTGTARGTGYGYAGSDTSQVKLSSGRGYSFHDDFYNVWDPATLKALVDHCVVGGLQCDARGYDQTHPEAGAAL